jgi:histidinol-phosphatase (PHP family)
MVDAARANHVNELSITEHVSQFREPRESIGFGSVHLSGRIFVSLKEYIREFEKLDPPLDDVTVNRGLEVDFSPRYEARVGNFVNQMEWDILLCSVHELEDGKHIESQRARQIDPRIAQQRWREYLNLEQIALQSTFVPFKVLAHPVRMARANPIVPPEFDELLLKLASDAKRMNKALELNGGDIEYAPRIVRRLAFACSKAGCNVSLGSDAHHPKDIFKNLDVGLNLVEELKLELV